MENIYEKLHSLYFSPNNVTVIGSTWIGYTRQMTALKKKSYTARYKPLEMGKETKDQVGDKD